jgi:hypothetical protein
MCELHCNIKLLLVFYYQVILVVSSLEFPVVIFLVICVKETMINELDAW